MRVVVGVADGAGVDVAAVVDGIGISDPRDDEDVVEGWGFSSALLVIEEVCNRGNAGLLSLPSFWAPAADGDLICSVVDMLVN